MTVGTTALPEILAEIPPEILAAPPWRDKKRKRGKPVVVEGLTPPATVEAVWLPGEREDWLTGYGVGWIPEQGWEALRHQILDGISDEHLLTSFAAYGPEELVRPRLADWRPPFRQATDRARTFVAKYETLALPTVLSLSVAGVDVVGIAQREYGEDVGVAIKEVLADLGFETSPRTVPKRKAQAAFDDVALARDLSAEGVGRVRRGVLEAFRVAEDLSFADVDDARYEIPADAPIGVAHPVDLGGALGRWFEMFSDDEILQSFDQLGRPPLVLNAEELAGKHLVRPYIFPQAVSGSRTIGVNWFGPSKFETLASRGRRRGPIGADRLWSRLVMRPGRAVRPVTAAAHEESGPRPLSEWPNPFGTLDSVTAFGIRDLIEETAQ